MGVKFNPLGIGFSITGPSGGGGGAVTSVNGQTGAVNLDAADISYDNSLSGLLSTEVQAAVDELADRTSQLAGGIIYVDAVNGSDVTGTGGVLTPLQSINAAVALVTNPAIGYLIKLAPGTYNGATVNWPVNADLQGSGANSTTVQQTIQYIAALTSSTSFNMSMVTMDDLFFDFTDADIALPTLFDGSFSLVRDDNKGGGGPWAIRINDSTLVDVDFKGNNLLSNCLFVSTANIQSGSSLLCSDCIIGINVDLYGTGSIALTGCTVSGTLNGNTIGPDTPDVISDAGSLANATLVNMDVILTDASEYVSYDNSGSGLTANNVQDAIDELAAVPSGALGIEYRTVTAPEATAKALTLAATPSNPSLVVLGIAGAPTQVYGTDFTVSGAVLSWSGTALDGILAAGDQLLLQYNV